MLIVKGYGQFWGGKINYLVQQSALLELDNFYLLCSLTLSSLTSQSPPFLFTLLHSLF